MSIGSREREIEFKIGCLVSREECGGRRGDRGRGRGWGEELGRSIGLWMGGSLFVLVLEVNLCCF